MINKLRFGTAGAAFAAALGMSSAAYAQDSATADATAEILSALTLEVDSTESTLDFGQMVLATGNANTVSLAADGTLTCDGIDIVCSGTTGVARFNITAGTLGKDVTVNLPDTTGGPIVLSNGAGGTTQLEIELDNFVASSGTITLDGTAANDTFTVGGEISLDGDETPGVFDGTFTVSVEYA